MIFTSCLFLLMLSSQKSHFQEVLLPKVCIPNWKALYEAVRLLLCKNHICSCHDSKRWLGIISTFYNNIYDFTTKKMLTLFSQWLNRQILLKAITILYIYTCSLKTNMMTGKIKKNSEVSWLKVYPRLTRLKSLYMYKTYSTIKPIVRYALHCYAQYNKSWHIDNKVYLHVGQDLEAMVAASLNSASCWTEK